MHKLNRNAVTAPACLSNYSFPEQTWDDLAQSDKQSVKEALLQMQSNPSRASLRCAYCESIIYSGGHIEHFRRKNPKKGYPKLTFDWTNLFFSCESSKHCGHFKDRQNAAPYNPDELLKPDVDDPSMELYFHSSGEVRERRESKNPRRAKETIRVFNLNEKGLLGKRGKVCAQYAQFLRDLMDFSQADRQEFITQEVQQTQWEPYATTIRHFFERQL